MRLAVLSVFVACCAAIATAQTTYVNSTSLGYTGTVTKYSDDDLTQFVSSAAFSGSRDLHIEINNGFGSPTDHLILGTGYDLTGSTPATQTNPNNINPGFVQLLERGVPTSTISSSWDDTLTVFSLTASGTNILDGSPGAYYTRLWNLDPTLVQAGQGGTFLSYDFAMTATFDGADAAQLVSVDGQDLYQAIADPTSVKGYFNGVFQNTSTLSQYNGYFVFDLSLNLDSWANQNQASLSGYRPVFASAIPEPSTYALCFGLGVLALAAVRRWRR